MPISKSIKTFWDRIGISLVGASVLLLYDVALTGSCLWSILVCPIWFLISFAKNVIQRPGPQRPGRIVILSRIAVPAIKLWVIMANDAFQNRMATENAEKVIAACEAFHAEKDRYPKTLNELVPKYMSSVSRAKYCIGFGDFWYVGSEENPLLFWHVVPPYGRRTYRFEDKRWGYLD